MTLLSSITKFVIGQVGGGSDLVAPILKAINDFEIQERTVLAEAAKLEVCERNVISAIDNLAESLGLGGAPLPK